MAGKIPGGRNQDLELGGSMVITFVIDMYDVKKNGTTMTAQRFAHYLQQLGHEIRVVSTGDPGPGKYPVPQWKIPIVQHFSSKQSFIIAKPDDEQIRRAIEGSDLVHLFLPFPLEVRAYHIAREMGIPCSAAFHLQPENITYNIHMGRWRGLSDFVYYLFREYFYKNFEHIHCPSYFMAEQLKAHGYKAKLHVISNGIIPEFCPGQATRQDELIHILMVGRLSPEKRQDLLIKAAGMSRHAEKIQLHFAGSGPWKQMLAQRGKKLKHPPVFDFYSKPELIELIRSCDLYVHASDAESEAIACLEAIACGLVPVISDSKLSATGQFALDERSLFHAGDAASLAEQIDYWIDHPEEKARMSSEYAKSTEKYRIEHCVREAETMFEEAVRDARGTGRPA